MFGLGRRYAVALVGPTVCGRVRHASEASAAGRPRAKVNLPPSPRPVSMDRLVFVGTSSQQPIRERNTSGVGIRLSNGRSILIDVGEATQHAMLRRDMPVGPSNIDTICITHLHGDHVLGADQREMVVVIFPVCRAIDTLSILVPLVPPKESAEKKIENENKTTTTKTAKRGKCHGVFCFLT